MNLDLSKYIAKNEVIAVALSGGSDSMALFEYLLSNQKKYNFKVVALNIEHGIRGKDSLSDSQFVSEYCKKKGVPLLLYSIDSINYAKQNGLTIEEGARELRYNCFYDAINSGKCDKVATAHHLSDNFESLLLNLFRGTGIKGLTGIADIVGNKIIRPFISISKEEIMAYINKNNIPFVTDSTNFESEYTRNFLRLNIIPKIKEVFPEVERTALRLNSILKDDNDFIDNLVEKYVKVENQKVYLLLPTSKSIISRATIFAMKYLGIKKDWAKSHIDEIENLVNNENGSKVILPQGVIAIKEYDKICFYREKEIGYIEIPFNLGEFIFYENKYLITKVDKNVNLKEGFFADLDKIPIDAVIRCKKDGDVFKKFGGGSKKLNDFLTDKKIPLKDREQIPVIAKGNIIYFIFKIAISDLIKVDENSKNIVQFI